MFGVIGGLGHGEILGIAHIAILLFGKRLPEIRRELGRRTQFPCRSHYQFSKEPTLIVFAGLIAYLVLVVYALCDRVYRY